MLKLAICVLLVSICSSSAGFTNIQTSTYEDIPQDCVGRIDPSPFVKIGHNYYLLELNTKQNWYEAAHRCKALDAELVSIETLEEMDAISAYLSEKNIKSKYIWTSGNDLGKEGTFKWFGTGNSIVNARWGRSQPDNAGGVEHCVHIWCFDNVFTLNDLNCKDKQYYICEMNKPKTITFTVW